MVVGHEPVLDQHSGPHPRPQVLGDVGRHGVEVGLHGGGAGDEQLVHVHEELVDHRPQPSGGQLPGTTSPRRPPGLHLLLARRRHEPEQREQRGRGFGPGQTAELGEQRLDLPAAFRTDRRSEHPVPPHPRRDLVLRQPAERADLLQPGDLVAGDAAVALDEPRDGRVQQRVARRIELLAVGARPDGGAAAGVRVEQLGAARGVRLDQQRDERAVAGVVALALPERPDLGHPLRDGRVVQLPGEFPVER